MSRIVKMGKNKCYFCKLLFKLGKVKVLNDNLEHTYQCKFDLLYAPSLSKRLTKLEYIFKNVSFCSYH
jgi:hypothetical protein